MSARLTAIVARNWVCFRIGDLLIIPYAAGYYYVTDIIGFTVYDGDYIVTIHDLGELNNVHYVLSYPFVFRKQCRRTTSLYFEVKRRCHPGIYHMCGGERVAEVYNSVVGDMY